VRGEPANRFGKQPDNRPERYSFVFWQFPNLLVTRLPWFAPELSVGCTPPSPTVCRKESACQKYSREAVTATGTWSEEKAADNHKSEPNSSFSADVADSARRLRGGVKTGGS
jgi:hypothetical protein